jgi:sugar lactone lactonase YvrE
MRPFPLLILSLAILPLKADDPVPRWRALNQEARAAVQAKDYAKLRETLLALKPLMPGNPRIAYKLAAADARLGNRVVALAELRNLAGMGLVFDFAGDEDFASLRESADFAADLRQIDDARKPVTHAITAFTLPERDLIPEDIAYDPKTRRFFISSVRKGIILTGNGKQFARADWSVFALRVDAVRRTLWATTAWIEHCERCEATDEGKTALLAFDLDSGALKRRIESPVKGVLGDMTVATNGDIYVSESLHGALFRLRSASGELERLDVPGELASPQTPALSADEKTLYVPDYLRGIAAVDLATRSVKWLEPADNIALSGIDGLYVSGDSFLAVQNGTAPPRLIRFSLDLRKQEVLEVNWPGLGDPTHGVIVGNEFYFIANSGWGEYDQHGKKKAESAPVESTIRKITIRK